MGCLVVGRNRLADDNSAVLMLGAQMPSKKSLIQFLLLWLLITTVTFVQKGVDAAGYRDRVHNAFKTQAVVTTSVPHRSSSGLFDVEYVFTGFDGQPRKGHELLSKSQWQSLETKPPEQRFIDIYQSRVAPDESQFAQDWDAYLTPEDLPSAFFDCALLGLFVTVPAFLLFRLFQSQLRFHKPWLK